jgi:hypothetical protein
MNNAQNNQQTANMMQIINFPAPKRLTRKAMSNALSGLGNEWYCKTVNGQAAFFFPQTNTAFVPDNSNWSDFHMHLRCSDFTQQTSETPHNWH